MQSEDHTLEWPAGLSLAFRCCSRIGTADPTVPQMERLWQSDLSLLLLPHVATP